MPSALAFDFVTMFVASAVLSIGDAVQVAMRSHPSVSLSANYGALGLGLSAWIAALGALVLAPARVLGRALAGIVRRPLLLQLLRGVGHTLLAWVVCALVLRPWELARVASTYRPVSALAVTVLLVALALSIAWERVRPWAAGAAGVLAVLALVGDATVLVSVYPRWHDVALLGAMALASVAVRGFTVWTRRRVAPSVGAAALVFQVALVPSVRSVVELGAEKGLVVPWLVSSARWVTDRDEDRFSSVLDGGDCDDHSAAVFPGQCEVPGNGIDDNCNGLVDPTVPPSASVAPRAQRPVSPDVYFILLDGVRADFAGAARADLTPEFEALAAQSVEFRRAYTSYPSTFRAILTLQTSRYWRYLGPRDERFFDVASRAGWDVALWIRDQRIHGDLGSALALDRKSDPFHIQAEGKGEWTAKIVDDAIAELAVDGTPRMRWLHVLDAHAPWAHGDPHSSSRDQYRAEVAHASKQLGRFLGALDASPRGRRAVVVLMADHGEALGEHGAGSHGGTLYEELLHVPLLMRLPGVAPAHVDGLTSLLDVVPTLAHYLGLPAKSSWQGFDWLSSCEGDGCTLATQGPTPRVLAQLQASAGWGYAGLPALQAASDGRYKLLVDLDRGRRMIFDLEGDPGELAPLAEPPPAVVKALEATLAQWEDLPGCSNRL